MPDPVTPRAGAARRAELRALAAAAEAALTTHRRAEDRPSRKTEMAAFAAREALYEAAAPAIAAALCTRLDAQAAMLRRLEWLHIFEGPRTCIVCRWEEDDGHRADCELAALLAAEGDGA